LAERYLIALGSNVRHHRHGPPRQVLRAALETLEQAGIEVERRSRVIETAPHGPSLRRYANAAAVVASSLEPEAMLAVLKRIERRFGRRRGRRWGARVLDLDIVLWKGGPWSSPGLTVPHVAFRHRRFVLLPAAEIAGSWRDPLSGLTLRQLAARRYTL
jgi:2-amino-4-hydroxy-6-hydroxymethyldihydropteridine diphosphokinase